MRNLEKAIALENCLNSRGQLAIRQSDTSDPQMDVVVVENWDFLLVGFEAQIAAYDAQPGFHNGLHREHVDRLRKEIARQSAGTGSQQWFNMLSQTAAEIDRHIPMRVLASTFGSPESESPTLFVTLPTRLRGRNFDEMAAFTEQLYRQVDLINMSCGKQVATFGGLYEGSDVIAICIEGTNHLIQMYELICIAHNAVVDMKTIPAGLMRRIFAEYDRLRDRGSDATGVDAPEIETEAVRAGVAEKAAERVQLPEGNGTTRGEEHAALVKCMQGFINLLATDTKLGLDAETSSEIQKRQASGDNPTLVLNGDINVSGNLTINIHTGPVEDFNALPVGIQSQETTENTDNTEE